MTYNVVISNQFGQNQFFSHTDSPLPRIGERVAIFHTPMPVVKDVIHVFDHAMVESMEKEFDRRIDVIIVVE